MDQWAWTRQQAVRYLGINMACGALVGVTCFGCIGPLAKKFDDRKLLIFVGIIPLIIGKVISQTLTRFCEKSCEKDLATSNTDFETLTSSAVK